MTNDRGGDIKSDIIQIRTCGTIEAPILSRDIGIAKVREIINVSRTILDPCKKQFRAKCNLLLLNLLRIEQLL
jgi:hypothetical protein